MKKQAITSIVLILCLFCTPIFSIMVIFNELNTYLLTIMDPLVYGVYFAVIIGTIFAKGNLKKFLGCTQVALFLIFFLSNQVFYGDATHGRDIGFSFWLFMLIIFYIAEFILTIVVLLQSLELKKIPSGNINGSLTQTNTTTPILDPNINTYGESVYKLSKFYNEDNITLKFYEESNIKLSPKTTPKNTTTPTLNPSINTYGESVYKFSKFYKED